MKKTVVIFGDSNTHGYETATDGRFDENKRYTGILEERLKDICLIREEGLGGRTASFRDPLFPNMSGMDVIDMVLKTHEPLDLLLIMLGTNDVKERFSATPENIAKGMEHLLEKAAQTKGVWRKKPNILLICPPPIDPIYEKAVFAGEMGKGCAEKSAALAKLYKETAKQCGAAFLDAGSIEGIEMHRHDGMHLTEESHRLLAETLEPLIRSMLADE